MPILTFITNLGMGGSETSAPAETLWTTQEAATGTWVSQTASTDDT